MKRLILSFVSVLAAVALAAEERSVEKAGQIAQDFFASMTYTKAADAIAQDQNGLNTSIIVLMIALIVLEILYMISPKLVDKLVPASLQEKLAGIAAEPDAEEAPVEEAPVEEAPVEEAPTEEAPVENTAE